MKKRLFKDLFDFQIKSALPAGKGIPVGSYPFFTSSKVQSKYLDTFQFSGEYLIFGTGGEPSIHYNRGEFAASSDCVVAKPNPQLELFNPKYVYYYLTNNISILEAGFRGGGLKHISKAYISNISVPLPAFGIQNQIVSVLEKGEKILEHGNALLKSLDQFALSVYFSMFKQNDGLSSKGLVELRKLALPKKGSIRTGPFGSNLKHSEFLPNGAVRVIGLDNVVTNSFKEGQTKFITKKKFLELKTYQLFPRDLLIALMGTGTTGKSAVVPDIIPLSINTKHLAAISLDSKIANPYYISFTIHSNPEIINQIALKNKGAVVPGINLRVVKALKFRLPQIKLQNKFERILRKIDKIKLKVTTRIQKAEFLYEVLMYNSFTGNLKINLKAFSFDDQMVDFLETEEIEKKNLTETEQRFSELKTIVESYFSDKAFTFQDLEQALLESEFSIEYDYTLPREQKGLKDFVFKVLEPANNTKPFLNQVFLVDENRDSEKKIDNSKIVFEINN